MSLKGDLAPLQGILDQILGRISKIENKVGVDNSDVSAPSEIDNSSDSPAVIAYQKHIKTSLEPFITSINSLSGLSDSCLGDELNNAWSAIDIIVVAGSQCKKPSTLTDLSPLLKPAQTSIAKIQKLRLAREYDNHIKAIMEMITCLGWVMIDATSEPPSPSLFVKNCVGSSDFWSNKIRKEFRSKEDDVSKANIQFCDTLKALILDLAAYTKEYHMSGLSWNFNGVDFKSYTPTEASTSADTGTNPSVQVTSTVTKSNAGKSGGGIADIKAELAKKTSSAGNSAATGLKKVTKDLQTWRKEFKNKDASAPSSGKSGIANKFSLKKNNASSVKATPPPVFEYRERGSKWVIEYQTKQSAESHPNGIFTVEVTDPKQHVYIYKCDNVTFDIKGKSNSIIVDTCTKCNIVFENVISSCEVVNCKKIQTQVKGICPSFSVDKTDGFLTYLSKESVPVTNFVTCKSSEMNVNYPDENDEIKELPIPEQFQHKLVDGVLRSDVSDLYH